MSGVAMKEQKPGDGVNNNDNGDAKSGLPGKSRSQKKNVGLSSVSDGAKNSPDHEGEAQDGGEKGSSDASAGSTHMSKNQELGSSGEDRGNPEGSPVEDEEQRPSKVKGNEKPGLTNDGEAGEGPDAIESTAEDGQEGTAPSDKDKVTGLVQKGRDGQGSTEVKEKAPGLSRDLWKRLLDVILSPLRLIARSFRGLLSLGADKQLREFEELAEEVNALAERFEAMSDEELYGMTSYFRERYKSGETLDELLPEAFAAVREASGRALGMRHFDEQIMGGITLHRGMIAEMKTGEGKTLVAPLAAYLNAIPAGGVHVVTVNDYLARRDSEWMGGIYERLGMSVGCLQNGMRLDLKKPAYAADITYGTNSEFGFDYLRDNMVTQAGQRVQRGHAFAIVDEVDSILIDEARTPLIISGVGTKSASTYKDFARAVRGLAPDVDFEMDEAKHTIAATEEGLRKIERRLGIDDLYSDPSGQLVNHLQQALRAQYLFHRDQQYMVVGGEVKIVDEFTGRAMEGRRYSEGLHQAIEAKEGVFVKEENQTLATITLQNYFRLYDKLSGMTGTAVTEDSEFREIYKLSVQAIPTHEPMIRKDNPDLVYQGVDAKFAAVADDIVERHRRGQPVLVGTTTVEASEELSRLLKGRGIGHKVLNAKDPEREAAIVAEAGRAGAVTIVASMAGCGTDIPLGGSRDHYVRERCRELGVEDPEDALDWQAEQAEQYARNQTTREGEAVRYLGGLMVIGTERHESRRIDDQLCGRSGRQGDPGESRFYLSLEDKLLRNYSGEYLERMSESMEAAGLGEGEPVGDEEVTRLINVAQEKVESIHAASRKQVLDYDDVMDRQRRAIYAERNAILDGKDAEGRLHERMRDLIDEVVGETCGGARSKDDRDIEGLNAWVHDMTGDVGFDAAEVGGGKGKLGGQDELAGRIEGLFVEQLAKRKEEAGPESFSELCRRALLRSLDLHWIDHLVDMDRLKQGMGLRGMAQRDSLVEYKREAYDAFDRLVKSIDADFLRTMLNLEVGQDAQAWGHT